MLRLMADALPCVAVVSVDVRFYGVGPHRAALGPPPLPAVHPPRPSAAATANVQASKVVRAKRSVEKPHSELEPAAPDASEAADAVAELAAREQQEQSQAAAALAGAALAGRRGGGSSLTMALPALPMALPALPAGDPAAIMQLMALQQQQAGVAAPMPQLQQEARPPAAAAAAGAGTTGKKRRGRPPKHARVEEEPEYEPSGGKRIKVERAASLPPQVPESLDPDVRWGGGLVGMWAQCRRAGGDGGPVQAGWWGMGVQCRRAGGDGGPIAGGVVGLGAQCRRHRIVPALQPHRSG